MNRRLASAIVAVALAVSGCASESLSQRTDALPRGTVVSAQDYLNDAATVTGVVRAFSQTLSSAGDTVTIAEARKLAPQLTQQAATARALCNRLSAARLDDTRLETQRAAVAAPLNRVCATMETVARLASQGQVRQMIERADTLPAAIDEVRTAGGR